MLKLTVTNDTLSIRTVGVLSLRLVVDTYLRTGQIYPAKRFPLTTPVEPFEHYFLLQHPCDTD